jgi:drug/metabolite transporter (DMT)-like permease
MMAGVRSPEWSRQSTAAAAALLILAWLLFTVEMVLVRKLSSDLPVVQVSFFRLTVQLALLLPFILANPSAILSTNRLRLHAVRAGCSALVMPIYYFAFVILPFAVVTTITFTQALFLVILAAVVGGERVGPRRWVATAIGFLGVVVIMRPGVAAFEPMVLFVLTGAMISATLMLITRQLGKTESGMTIMAYVSILGTIYLSGPTWYLWQPPDAAQLLILVTIGIVGTTGQFLFVHAFKRAEASALAPIDYVRLVFAVLAGYFLYAEIPDLWTWTGAAIIITSALAVTRLEHRAERSLRGSTP